MRSFDELYREHSPAVYRLAMRYVGRPEIAEEITSETFLALYQQYSALAGQGGEVQFPAWLFTVAKRRAIDHWRGQLQEQRVQVEEPVAELSGAAIDLEQLFARTSGLKPVHRVCVVLRYLHGMSREEIAVQLGLSEMQVKGHLQYALKLLKQQLAPSGKDADAEPTR